MDTLIIACQLILSLSILVVTHEFGHFLFSKIFGVKVPKFYMFFDPYFSIFKYLPDGPHDDTDTKEGLSFCTYTDVEEQISTVKKSLYDADPAKYTLLGKDSKVLSESFSEIEEEQKGKKVAMIKITRRVKCGYSLISFARNRKAVEASNSKSWWRNTDFGLGWLPLGGYCQISGMVDETQSADQIANKPVEPWEFRAKPAWQRLLIMIGGVLVNFISAPIIFWFALYTWGETYVPIDEAPLGLQYHEVMKEVGFQDGDLIVAIDGNKMETYKDIANTILLNDTCTVEVLRNDEKKLIGMPREFFRTILSKDVEQLCFLRWPVVVDSVLPDSPAFAAGMLHGDSIIGVNDMSIVSRADFDEILPSRKGQPTTFVVVREDRVTIDTLTVNVSDEGRIGVFTMSDLTRWINVRTREYGFFEALPAGIDRGCELLVNYFKQLPLLFTKEGATKVGGFGTIAKLFPDSWNWRAFWFNTAFLAIILAVMNILPIPALDGGFVMFLIVEVITGKKIPDKFLEYAQMVGMALVLLLVLYANGNDIFRYLF